MRNAISRLRKFPDCGEHICTGVTAAKPNQTSGLIPAYWVVVSLGHTFPLTLLSEKGRKGQYNFMSDDGFCQGLVNTKVGQGEHKQFPHVKS